MSGHVYKQIEITGTSTDSIEDAVKGALAKASESVRNMRWMEILLKFPRPSGRSMPL